MGAGLGRLMQPKEAKTWMAFVAYPDSLLPDGTTLTFERLYQFMLHLGVTGAISPLHEDDEYDEYDVNDWMNRHKDKTTGKVPDDVKEKAPKIGDKKKAHWHVMFKYSGKKYLAGLRKTFRELNIKAFFVDFDKVVQLRYFCHLDNPEKAQYSPDDVTGFGGMDLTPLYKKSEREMNSYLKATFTLIKERGITNYYDLINTALDIEDEGYFDVVTEKSPVINLYMVGYERKMFQQMKWGEN